MKSPLAILSSIVLGSILIPIIISIISYGGIDNTQELSNNKQQYIDYETVDKDAPIIQVYNSKTKQVEDMNIEEYLYGVVAGEVPTEFDVEAIKAQAVAARTFVMYKLEQDNPQEHEGAVMCTDHTHCQEYKSYDDLMEIKGEEWIEESYPKIKQAVDETKGHILTYDDKPILTLYFSTSSGNTENSEEVFSEAYPYLRSVSSPYDIDHSPKSVSVLKVSNKDFVDILKKSYSDINIDESNLRSEIEILKRSEGGSVEIIRLGDKEVSGREVRNIFDLNSANFEINFGEGYLDFVVKGYGHGVGMSQWGAHGMALEGYRYYEILEHYYTDTKIKDIY